MASSPKASGARTRGLSNGKTRTPSGAIGGLLGALIMSVVAGILVTVAVTPVVAIGGQAARTAIDIFENLPSHLDPGQIARPSTMYAKDSNGNDVELATFFSQNREMVEWDEISQYVKDAAVAAEDPRFFTHGGVDVFSLGRAVLGQITDSGNSGASTISMQYVRNVLIQQAEAIPDEDERKAAYEDAVRQDADRKLKEMRYAISIEKKYSKDEILLGYLNIALFGRTVYGIESAAQYFYGKRASEVTLSEAASLVGMVQNPSKLRIDNPDNIPANTERRNYVLRSMLGNDRITQEQYDEALATEVVPNITPRDSGCSIAETNYGLGHFCDFVQRYILNDSSFGNSATERNFNFLRGGYKITTSIDLDMQAAAVSSIRSTVPAQMARIDIGTQAVSVEVGTGRVLAMAQNRPFSADQEVLDSNGDYTSINYSTDYEYGGSRGFQTGSTSKAWTLAEWIRTGHSVQDIVNGNGRQVNSSQFKAHCLPGGVYGSDSWKVTNDGGANYGNITVMRATASSINAGFVSMQQRLDLCDTADLATSLGVHRAYKQTNPGFENYDTTRITINPNNFYAGTDEVAPITVANAYAAFANNGTTCTAVPIDAITDANGDDVMYTKSKCTQAVSAEVAAGVLYAFEGVVRNGTARHAQSKIGIPHFAKTGTTDDWVDMWTVGGSSKVVTATWTGNVVGKVSTRAVGKQWSGRTIWPAIMNVADRKYGGDAFPSPSASALTRTMVTVPSVAGMSYADAEEMLISAGFEVIDGGEADSTVAAGLVAGTNPEGGSQTGSGSAITIYRSNGSMSAVPNVVGMDYSTAVTTLTAAGFSNVNGQLSAGCTPTTPNVVSQTPGAGAESIRTSMVTLSCVP